MITSSKLLLVQSLFNKNGLLTLDAGPVNPWGHGHLQWLCPFFLASTPPSKPCPHQPPNTGPISSYLSPSPSSTTDRLIDTELLLRLTAAPWQGDPPEKQMPKRSIRLVREPLFVLSLGSQEGLWKRLGGGLEPTLTPPLQGPSPTHNWKR